MENMLCAVFGNSWRTSLSGYVFAIAQVCYPLLERGSVTWKEIVLAGVTAIVGRLVKDAGHSGPDCDVKPS